MVQFEKLDTLEQVKLSNLDLNIENLQLKLQIVAHDKEEFIKQLEEKYKEKEDGNDR